MSNAKLNEADVRAINDRLNAGDRATAIARDFVISQQSVSAIKNGKAWGHVTGRSTKDPREHKNRGVLNREQVLAIDAALKEGVRPSHLAEQYGVSHNTIYQLRLGQTWAWLTGRLVCERRGTRG